MCLKSLLHSLFTSALVLLISSLSWADVAQDKVAAGRAAFLRGDYKAARVLLLPEAEQGNPEALYWLGTLYSHGAGALQDQQRALTFFRKAARAGHTKAQFIAGFMLYHGMGTVGGAPQRGEAGSWLKAAAEKGNALAQYLWGEMLLKGDGFRRDEAAARDWLAKAAQADIPAAQYSLALLDANAKPYTRRIGALTWFYILERRGYPGAAENAVKVAATLSAAEVESARRAAEAWLLEQGWPESRGGIERW